MSHHHSECLVGLEWRFLVRGIPDRSCARPGRKGLLCWLHQGGGHTAGFALVESQQLVSLEVSVSSGSPGAPLVPLDFSKQSGNIVMLDAVGADGIYSARIVSIAAPVVPE
ncbi:hypothetical protein MesoLj113b_66620 [Mesorhizobium sp. 113-3-3]|nr:hypothetical protein MesoLj113b_66620 [Mesorhizobium sp. 113-3-3]